MRLEYSLGFGSLSRSCAFAYLGRSLAYRRKKRRDRIVARNQTSTFFQQQNQEPSSRANRRQLTLILRLRQVIQPVLVRRLISCATKRVSKIRGGAINRVYYCAHLLVSAAAHNSRIVGNRKRISHTRWIGGDVGVGGVWQGLALVVIIRGTHLRDRRMR